MSADRLALAEREPGDFGRILREARERKGVSLRQIANATKISVAVLEGLERNDISRLPGGIFGRAFVRSFASEVGLDPEKTIQAFIAHFQSDTVTPEHAAPERFEDGEALMSRRRRALRSIGLVVVGVPLAAGALYFAMVGRRAPALPEPAPPPAASTVPALETTQAAATPAPPRAATSDVGLLAAGPEDRPASADAGVDRFVVNLTVSRRCWLSATVDGRKRIERVLQPGDRRTVEVYRDLVLTTGDAGAVALTINGTLARPLGKSGEVVTARMDLANFRTFLPAR